MWLLLAHFLQALGFSSMLLLPLYLAELGASRAEIGAVMAAANAGGLASRPLVGWALDAWGRRPTLLVGTAVLTASMVALGGVQSMGPWVYVDRVFLGAGIGALFAGYFTWASDVIPPRRRTEGVALFGISGLLPLALNAFADDAGLRGAELRFLFVALSGAVALSGGIVLALDEPAGGVHPGEQASARFGELLRGLLSRSLLPVWWASAVFSGLVGVFFAFATVSAASRGVDDPARLWLTYAGGAVGVRLLGARLPDRIGPANLVVPAVALYLGAFALAAVARSSGGFAWAGVLAGLGHGVCFPVLMSQVVGRSASRQRGTAVSLFTAVWGICELVLPPLAGLGADRWGDSLLYHGVVWVGLAGLVVWAALEHWADPRGAAGAQTPAAGGT
ncbi:MAG: MFS transporter [Planctomycetota bacterium]|nr:MAG: MFS transporter [Planctomycetota bacterium]